PAPSASIPRREIRGDIQFSIVERKVAASPPTGRWFATGRSCYMIRDMSKAATMQAVRGRGLTSRDGLAEWLLVAPAVLCIVLLFVLPIGYVLLLSVTEPTVSLDHYRRFFTVPLYAKAIVNTVPTSFISTLPCLTLPYPPAHP